MWKPIFEQNAYVFNRETDSRKVVVISTQFNRHAMWYEDIRKDARYIWIDKTHKPESNPPLRGVHGASKLDWVTVWFLGWNLNQMVSPGAAV